MGGLFWGSGGGVPTLKNFAFFCKNNSILGLRGGDLLGRPWPRGHVLKSLTLVSKVKSLALDLTSKPQVLENWPILGSRTALFFDLL